MKEKYEFLQELDYRQWNTRRCTGPFGQWRGPCPQ